VQEGWGIVCPTRFNEQIYSFLPRNENSLASFFMTKCDESLGVLSKNTKKTTFSESFCTV
jgi:hypothetical protein